MNIIPIIWLVLAVLCAPIIAIDVFGRPQQMWIMNNSPLTLNLIAFLSCGASILFSGTSVAGRMFGLLG